VAVFYASAPSGERPHVKEAVWGGERSGSGAPNSASPFKFQTI